MNDKERLIEHFSKEGAKPVLCITEDTISNIVTNANEMELYVRESKRAWNWRFFTRIATKQEALALVLSSDGEAFRCSECNKPLARETGEFDHGCLDYHDSLSSDGEGE